MTPARWHQIERLFDAAVQVEPAQRQEWLLAACGGDHELRADVSGLLAEHDRAERDGFLAPPSPAAVPTASWRPQARRATTARLPDPADADDGGFTPKAVIARSSGPAAVSEPEPIVRARLRELPIIYILVLGSAMFWSYDILGETDSTLALLNVGAIIVLGGIIALLWSRWPASLASLKAIEIGMIVMLAGLLAYTQYRLMLRYALRDDRMMAQLTMRNVVLVTTILVLTYGLYVPKSWRRAALGVGPVAALPFATLGLLVALHPQAMAWLYQGWRLSATPRIRLFIFDGLILSILAVGSTFGARTISRLRRQVAEARQLGQYRLRGRIGAGGMGEVYLAEHQLLKRPCAVKLIRPDDVVDPRALARFEREVRLTATLSHPNTVEIYDYGRAEDGSYYYVMEYLPGLTLAELVERHGPISPARAVYLVRQVCGALAEAHAAGLIHRDIKPSNIFAATRGGMYDVAKLLDFGLVRPATFSRGAHLSAEGQILGTPQFMSPEQATGSQELDARTDIYALGAVMYYLLTGRPPFDDENGLRVMVAHARDPVVPPSRIRAEVPHDVEAAVMRCLAKSAGDRPQDAESLERALGACACARDWGRRSAAEWWHDVDKSTYRAP